MADAGINELSENIFQSVLYPNPAKDNVVLNVHSVYPTDVTINIYDVMGRIIYTKNAVKLSAGENNININTSKFENGIYSIKIIANNGIITNKFSITK